MEGNARLLFITAPTNDHCCRLKRHDRHITLERCQSGCCFGCTGISGENVRKSLQRKAIRCDRFCYQRGLTSERTIQKTSTSAELQWFHCRSGFGERVIDQKLRRKIKHGIDEMNKWEKKWETLNSSPKCSIQGVLSSQEGVPGVVMRQGSERYIGTSDETRTDLNEGGFMADHFLSNFGYGNIARFDTENNVTLIRDWHGRFGRHCAMISSRSDRPGGLLGTPRTSR